MFTKPTIGVFDNVINATKMIGGFYYVVYPDAFVFFEGADGVGFVNVAGLVFGEAATLDMIGIIGEFYLDFVINATLGT